MGPVGDAYPRPELRPTTLMLTWRGFMVENLASAPTRIITPVGFTSQQMARPEAT